MINKKVDSIEEALKGVSDHMTFMLGGSDYVVFQKML